MERMYRIRSHHMKINIAQHEFPYMLIKSTISRKTALEYGTGQKGSMNLLKGFKNNGQGISFVTVRCIAVS